MTKHLLAGAAATVLLSGVAFAQTYPPAPPPPVAPPPLVAPAPIAPPVVPPAPAGSSSSTTTTITPAPDGGYRSSTTEKGVDVNGNEVTRKNIYHEGIAGSSETHTKTETDPFGGTTTRSTTTTNSPQ